MRASAGFTLIEIMVVVLIIAGLASLVGVKVLDQLCNSKAEQTKIQIGNLESGLKLFKIDNGFYPETQQGLEALVSAPGVGRSVKKFPSGGYLEGKTVPKDGWNNEYQYIGPDQTDDRSFEIISPGEDAELGTDDDCTIEKCECL
ncbi:MAG: type II secretion system major pseudopilin GspG [Candidatus Dadabacteria bacterium]|nr:type II secretion system major pseudopilin GspG [Candidatus Dadabacteria bacterium]NIS07358.1 type II secretion system major pseudopilin GspG [Candidatus Dadabacteria bacterium]NIV41302.1 type II secretion system major pseudopilin GspG [Candidatus Dadabacteria bacterium]NIX14537.1 type II secretion system major pseudopilin GspG [Candidatus Dadabacteria bacterium]NIY20995.1 type II secretion system major pseudopilin GspG [Candidatus Dadabacteria bacterium]